MKDPLPVYFEEAVSWYQESEYRHICNRWIKFIGNSGADEMIVPRKTLFIYPDLRLRSTPIEPRNFIHFYFTDHFHGIHYQ